MEELLERLDSTSPGAVFDRRHSITHHLRGVYDPALVDELYGLQVADDEDPSTVYQRLREVGNHFYASQDVMPPLNFTQSVLASMFSAPWTTDAYMEYVLDVFD
jgi:hypothetical protein